MNGAPTSIDKEYAWCLFIRLIASLGQDNGQYTYVWIKILWWWGVAALMAYQGVFVKI
jgi:predicted acyltransferase